MNKKLILASTGAAVIAAAGFGSIALAQDDTPTAPAEEGAAEQPTGELDAVPEQAPADGQEVFESEGGTVFAQCTDDGAELVWWVAAEGYTVDDVEAVPDGERDDDGDDRDGDDNDAEIEFRNGATDVDYNVTCADGQPRADVNVDQDDDGDDNDDDDGRDDDFDDDGDDGDDDQDDDNDDHGDDD